MSSTTAISGSTAGQFMLGARMFVPVAISIAAYGVVWGVLARQAGLSIGEVALMSGLVFAGASQFVALDLWTPGSLPIGAIVFAVMIVNLRLMLMTATLRPLVAHLPPWRAALSMWFVSDENWALTMAEVAKGRGSLAYLLGGGVVCYFTWLASTLSGRLLGSAIDDPSKYGLDFAFTATFLALLFGMWRGKSDLVPWIVAALAAILTAKLVPGHWHIVVGGLVGSFTGAVVETRKASRDVA
jgi:predicted branched-subunit amino acid permease